MSSNTNIAVAKREIRKGEGIPAVAGKLTNRNPDKDLEELLEIANEAKGLVEQEEKNGSTDEKERANDDQESVQEDIGEDTQGVEDAPEWFEIDEDNSEPPDTEQLTHEEETPGEDSWGV